VPVIVTPLGKALTRLVSAGSAVEMSTGKIRGCYSGHAGWVDRQRGESNSPRQGGEGSCNIERIPAFTPDTPVLVPTPNTTSNTTINEVLLVTLCGLQSNS